MHSHGRRGRAVLTPQPSSVCLPQEQALLQRCECSSKLRSAPTAQVMWKWGEKKKDHLIYSIILGAFVCKSDALRLAVFYINPEMSLEVGTNVETMID